MNRQEHFVHMRPTDTPLYSLNSLWQADEKVCFPAELIKADNSFRTLRRCGLKRQLAPSVARTLSISTCGGALVRVLHQPVTRQW
jgi:hypothetical protein